MKFLRIKHRTVDNPRHEYTQILNRAVDSSYFGLSTAVSRKSGLSENYRQSPWSVDIKRILGESLKISEFVSYPNLEFLVFFSSETLCLIKEGQLPLILYPVII